MNIKSRPIRLLFYSILVWCAGISAHAQSNQYIDSFLAEDKASFGGSACLVLTAAGLIPENASIEDAIARVQAAGWKLKPKAQDAPITLGEYALLLMQAFGSRGGMMYSLFQNTWYAANEVAYWGWIQGDTSPDRLLTGDEVLEWLGNMLAKQATLAPQPEQEAVQ